MKRRKPSLTRARKKRLRYLSKLCSLSYLDLNCTIQFMIDQGHDLNQIERHLQGNTLFFGLVSKLANEKDQDFIEVLSSGISIFETVKMLIRINPLKYNTVYLYCMRYM